MIRPCLTGGLADFNTLEAQICLNLGIPNSYGTTSFLVIQQAYNEEFYWVDMPFGWAGNNNENFTQEQVLADCDLSPFDEVEFNPDWIPPEDE